jgi:hypothetical protein
MANEIIGFFRRLPIGQSSGDDKKLDAVIGVEV